MKILQINATYRTGSTGEIIAGIAQVSADAGFDTYYVCASLSEDQRNDHILVMGNRLDHKIHALRSRILGRQGGGSLLATLKLLKWIDEICPDIIHLHNLHSNYIHVPLLFRYIQRRGIKTVITLHDCWFFTGKCCHFLYDGCNLWKSGCGNCPRRRKDIPSYFFDRSAEDFKEKRKLIGENPYVHVVGCSQWITACARESLLAERVEKTICNGIDLNIFKPYQTDVYEELHKHDAFIILGMANKWLSEDGRETYDHVVKKLGPRMKLFLIGCTPKQIAENSNAHVFMSGFIKNRIELAKCFSSADVFVNVTKADSFPTVNIESIACGTPVITYDSGGSAEIVDWQTGEVVPYGNYEQLLQSITRIQEIGKKYYSEKCRQRAESLYNKKQTFLEYVELYSQISTNK